MKRLAVLSLILFSFYEAEARVGGGQSHSSGGSHSSGSGGGGGGSDLIGELLWFLVRTTFYYPLVGIPIDIVVIYLVVVFLRSKQGLTVAPYSSNTGPLKSSRGLLTSLRSKDPSFSETLFYDFATSLFTHIHTARAATTTLENFKFYLDDSVFYDLQKRSEGLKSIKGVALGSVKISNVSDADNGATRITVDFESCMSILKNDCETSLFLVEQWIFERTDVRIQKEFAVVATRRCPNCGSALENTLDQKCSSCGTQFINEEFGFKVIAIVIQQERKLPPLLTGYVPEEGTDNPTVMDPELEDQKRALLKRDPDFLWKTFSTHVGDVFLKLQQCWSNQTWELARLYETDYLFQTHQYWMQMYHQQGLRNVLEDVQVINIEPARILVDGPFDVITVRIFARMRDYTIDGSSSKVVGGRKQELRSFSEYWTLVRKSGVKRMTADETTCPSCGAALKISMAGICEFCGNKITRSDFGWVVSRIEQDESYSLF